MVLFRVIYEARRLNAKSIGVQTSTLPLSLPLSLTHLRSLSMWSLALPLLPAKRRRSKQRCRERVLT